MGIQWLIRTMSGAVPLVLIAAMASPLAHAGIMDRKPNATFAANTCDCSKCRSNQVCCRTANGGCGCFPGGIKC